MTSRRLPALLALAFAALYAATTRGVFVHGDDVLMFQVTESIVERGEVSVSSTAPPGEVTHGIPGRDGRRYAKYAPGLSLAAVPFYAAGRAIERGGVELPVTRDARGNVRTGTRVFVVGLTNALVGGLTVGVVAWTVLELGFGAGAAALVALLAGLCTPLAHYSTTFLSEPLSALGFAGAAAALAALERRAARDSATRGALLAGGIFAGLVVVAKVAHVVALPVLAAAVLVALGGGARPRRELATGLALWAAPAALALAALAAFNAARFGGPLETGYGDEARQFTRPFLEGLSGLLLSPGRGAVWYAPPIVVGVVGAVASWRRHRAVAVAALGVSAALLALYAKYYDWPGGGSWGPRFLVPALPLLVLPAAALVGGAGSARRCRLAALALAGALGAVVSLLPILVPTARHLPPSGTTVATAGGPSRLWSVGESPIVRHAREAPAALVRTASMMLGRTALPGPTEKSGESLPDLAFAAYGSHALLEWTRGALGVALAVAAAALVAARRGRAGAAAAASQ